MDKHLLLISYVFPPYPGIGGRRWAKFAKYLARKGYTVHVICAKNPFAEISIWIQDIQSENIKIHQLPLFYPRILLSQPKSIFEKIQYRVTKFLIKFLTEGNIYDRAIFSEKLVLKKSAELIKKYKINNLIVTGAPFKLNYFGTKLKVLFPHLQLINDFRDPWTWGHGFGFRTLSPSIMKREKRMEKEVMEKSDVITIPVDVMMEYLVTTYPEYSSKIFKLPHAYDEDEIKVVKKTNSNQMRLLFYGSIYDGIENEFRVVSEVLQKTNSLLKIISSATTYQGIFFNNGTLNKNVIYQKMLEPPLLFNEFKNYDYILMIHHKEIAEYISTKFYEIVYSRTPIIFIGPAGRTARFIIENNIGVHILPENIANDLPIALSQVVKQTYNLKFDINDYSFSKQTDFLISKFTE